MSWYGARKSKKQIMEGVAHVSAKNVANNTVEYIRADGSRVIRHHLTDIVEFLPNGVIRLSSGGFKTAVTKERIGTYLPKGWMLWSDKGLWYIGKPRWHKIEGEESVHYPFKDGMIIKPDGTVGGTSEREERKGKLLLKKINTYCKEIKGLVSLPLPEMGDCMYCSLQEVKTGKPLGEVSGDTSHLMSHLDEKYIHGSLLLNAMRAAEMGEMAIAWAFKNHDGYARQQAVRAVRKYFKKNLGLAA
jgi:hypothetical protein